MKVGDGIKDLAEHILSSYTARTKALGDLVSDVQTTLGDFAEERKTAGQQQGKYLSDFRNDLSTNVDEMLKGCRKNRKAMGDEQTKHLEGFAADLAKNTSAMLGLFLKGRQRMSGEQAKHLSAFAASIKKHVGAMLKAFYEGRQQMSDEQAKHLRGFLNNLTKDTSALMDGFKKTRGDTSVELKDKLAANLKSIQTCTKDKLKEFEKSHGRMSVTLKNSLAGYANELTKEVAHLLHGYDADMKKAAKSWDTMSSALSARRMKTTLSGVTGHEEISTVRKAFGKEEHAEKKPIPEMEVEGRVLDCINTHPEGVKVGSMEMILGLPRMKLGVKAKKLLNDGRVKKEANLYYPLAATIGSAIIVPDSGFSTKTH